MFSLDEHHLKPLLHFVNRAAPKWKEIGVALGFSVDELNTIAAKPKNISRGPIACFTDLLSRWLKWAPPKHHTPTLETLAWALMEDTVGEESMANKLMQHFQHKVLHNYYILFIANIFLQELQMQYLQGLFLLLLWVQPCLLLL